MIRRYIRFNQSAVIRSASKLLEATAPSSLTRAVDMWRAHDDYRPKIVDDITSVVCIDAVIAYHGYRFDDTFPGLWVLNLALIPYVTVGWLGGSAVFAAMARAALIHRVEKSVRDVAEQSPDAKSQEIIREIRADLGLDE